MQWLYILILQFEFSMTYGKEYSAYELNRLRITKLYRNHMLTRASTSNTNYTVVAIGLGIIEVEGIDPQKQVLKYNFF